MAKNHCNRKVQRGFTMIEVLIAVLILAIGLLGVAGVELVSMQQTANSTLRSEATMYAQSLADRVRSNGGLNLTATEIADLKKQVKAGLGPGADVAISLKSGGDIAEVQITWVERDPFAASGGTSSQTLTLDARL